MKTLQQTLKLGIAALSLAALAGCAGTRAHNEGLSLISQGKRDEGIAMLRQASIAEPTNAQFRLDLLNEQGSFARELVNKGDEARRLGKLAEARGLYARALQIDSANDRALRTLAALDNDERHYRMVAEAEGMLKAGRLDEAKARLAQVITSNPSNPAALKLQAQLNEQFDRQTQARNAQIAATSIMRKPVTLQFRDANVRMVFEALSRTTGLNVIFDRDVRADLKTTIFVKDATVEDTVDLILLQNQLEKKTLNANTLFIYPATAAKQKEYQDLQVRTFQLANADGKHLQTVLKNLLKIKDIAYEEKTGTLVIRDTPEAVSVATKIIAAHDVAEPEVMLEVEVLEVSRERLQNLGIELPDRFSVELPNVIKGTTNPLTARGVKDYNGGDLLVTSGLGAAINLKLQDGDSNVLASPRIRARNKEKAKILIGDKYPTFTRTETPSTSGPQASFSPVYLDIGLKLDIEPQIYSDQEVGIKVNLEVSSIGATVEVGSGATKTSAPIIGTRTASTSLRLRDGETQVLAGLIRDEEMNTASKVPGLGHLPIAGRLFGNNKSTGRKLELILSITPRIIRAPTISDVENSNVYSGSEALIREKPLRLDPTGAIRATSNAGNGNAGTAPRIEGAGVNAGGAATGSAPGAPPVSGSQTGGNVAQGSPVTANSNTASTTTGGDSTTAPVTPVTPRTGTTSNPGTRVLPPSTRPGGIFKPASPPGAPGESAPPPDPAPPESSAAKQPLNVASAPVAAGALVEPAARNTATGTPIAAAAPAAAGLAPAAAPAEAVATSFSWGGPNSAVVGKPFQVSLNASSMMQMQRLPLVLRYDGLVLSYQSFQLGELALKAGGEVGTPKSDVAIGRLDIPITFTRPELLQGDGALITLTFAPKTARASTSLVATQVDVKNAAGQLQTIARPQNYVIRTVNQ